MYDYAVDIFGAEYRALIHDRQFYGMRWFAPEKNQYTRADLEELFHHLSFAASAEHPNIVILEHADQLSLVCANSLLKLLEEPPVGYNTILLAQSREALLPTIQSRCIIREFGAAGEDQDFVAFVALFKNPTAGNQTKVMEELEKVALTEYQSRLALDKLCAHWSDQGKSAVQAGKEQDSRRAERMMRIIAHMAEHTPMPGSVKLFWRTLYLLMVL